MDLHKGMIERAKERSRKLLPIITTLHELQKEYAGVVGFWLHTEPEYSHLTSINVTLISSRPEYQQSFDFYGFRDARELNELLEHLEAELEAIRKGKIKN
ncbi:hypothetical protein LJB95_00890 [Paludibacteraceae bacterium OttesenSCG-928-F17]|nr:hypothetical protein [Paludibacteraceae bacterium OttesenSCG-928-F17]